MTHQQISELAALLVPKIPTALHAVIAGYEQQKLSPQMIKGKGDAEGDLDSYLTPYFETKACPFASVEEYNAKIQEMAPLLSLLKQVVNSKLNGTFKHYVSTLAEFGAAVVQQIVSKNLPENKGGIPFNSESETVKDHLLPRISDKHIEQIIKRQLTSWAYTPSLIDVA